MTIYAYC